MPGPWDSRTKQIIAEAPQDFVQWLIEGAIFERELSPHLLNRSRDADILYLIKVNDQSCILHIEFQKSLEPDMAKRMWEYNVIATCRMDMPVYSYLIYLKIEKSDHGKPVQSPYVWQLPSGQEVHRFNFSVILFWEVSTQAIVQTKLKGLLPLLTLTRDGGRQEVVEQAISGLYPEGEKPNKELLALTYGIAALVFTEEDDKEWLRWRFAMLEDILADSWAFKEIMEKGEVLGLKKGIEQGRRQEMEKGLEWQRETLVLLVSSRFPELERLAQERAGLLNTPEQLQDFILKVSMAKGSREAREHLLSIEAERDN